jgi:N-acetylglucosaminyldiphosphoundecaprenol N-acetyl-beta-D-mannosaminyltransferase
MRKHIVDIPIDWITEEELIRKLKLFVVSGKPHQITTVNPEFVVISRKNNTFKTILQSSDLSLADGSGILLAQALKDLKIGSVSLRWLGYIFLGFKYLLMPSQFPYKRITGIALTDILLQLSQQEGWRVFLLGAGPGIAQKAATYWREKYPHIHIVGVSASNPQDAHTVDEVKLAKPDILLVAYGAPKQELFIAHNREELKIPIMVGVGGTFDTAVGTKYNPPSFLKKVGLEWLGYLIRHPQRFKRIYNATVTFSRIIISNQD